jgi:replicative DNA helicase
VNSPDRAALRLLESAGVYPPQKTQKPQSSESWDVAPIELGARTLKPDFPVAVLPGWLGEFVAALAVESQTPPDLAGCLALAALSTAASGRLTITARGRWSEPGHIFTAVAMDPASRKSEVFRQITAPIHGAEKALGEAMRATRLEAEVTQRVQASQAEQAIKKAGTAGEDENGTLLAEAISAQATATEFELPVQPVLFVDDITPEAASSVLAEQSGRLAILSAEGGIFAIIAGRYSGAVNMDFFLKGHAGDTIKVNRRGREAEHVEHPALTLGLAVQPSVFRDCGQIPGAADRGLLARILYSLPESTLGRRDSRAPEVPAPVAETYHRRMQALALSFRDLTEPVQLALDGDAQEQLIDLLDWIEPHLGPGGSLAPIRAWAGKLAGAVVRIAGLLHIAGHAGTAGGGNWGQPIPGDTFHNAEQLGRYYLAHALAAFDLMGADPDLEAARTVLAWITRTAAPTFTRRDAFNALRSNRFPKVTALDPALTLLWKTSPRPRCATKPQRRTARRCITTSFRTLARTGWTASSRNISRSCTRRSSPPAADQVRLIRFTERPEQPLARRSVAASSCGMWSPWRSLPGWTRKRWNRLM